MSCWWGEPCVPWHMVRVCGSVEPRAPDQVSDAEGRSCVWYSRPLVDVYAMAVSGASPVAQLLWSSELPSRTLGGRW